MFFQRAVAKFSQSLDFFKLSLPYFLRNHSLFLGKKHKKALTFFIFDAKSVIFGPRRIAYLRPTDHVMTFERFMTSKNAKNFDKTDFC